MWGAFRLMVVSRSLDDGDQDNITIDVEVIDCMRAKLQFRHLPPTTLGSGATTLAHKFHAVLHSIFLIAGKSPQSFAKLCDSIATGTFDLGCESSLPRIRAVAPHILFPWSFLDFAGEGDDLVPVEDDWEEDPPEEGGAGDGRARDENPVAPPSIGFQAALPVPGLLHIIHNAGNALLSVMTFLDNFVSRTCLYVSS